jgi:serine protease Do
MEMPMPPMQMPAIPLDGPGGWIGVSVRDVDPQDVSRAKLSAEAGAVVDDVRPGSPASTAGLRQGDVIIELDGDRIRSARQLTRLVRETPGGRKTKVALMREGRRTEVEVTPTEIGGGINTQEIERSVQRLGEIGRDAMGRFGGGQRLGVTVQELTPQLSAYFGAKDGVLVSSVSDNSPAAKAGLKAGDVITAIGGRPIGSTRDLLESLRDVEDGREVTMAAIRDKNEISLKAALEGRPRRTRISRTA